MCGGGGGGGGLMNPSDPTSITVRWAAHLVVAQLALYLALFLSAAASMPYSSLKGTVSSIRAMESWLQITMSGRQPMVATSLSLFSTFFNLSPLLFKTAGKYLLVLYALKVTGG